MSTDLMVIENVDQAFDYSLLDQETATFVQIRTEQIKDKMKLVVSSVIEAGQKILEVKERLGHGQFGAWLKNELQISHETASNYMGVALQQNSWSSLPPEVQQNIAVSGMYYLSGANVSEDARQEAIERASNGEKITQKKAKQIVAERKKSSNINTSITGISKKENNQESEELYFYMGEFIEWVSVSGDSYSLRPGDKVVKSNVLLNDKSRVIVKLPNTPNSSVTVHLDDLDVLIEKENNHQKSKEFTLKLPGSSSRFVFCTWHDKNAKDQYRLVFKGDVSDSGVHTVYLDELPIDIEEYAESLLQVVCTAYRSTIVENVRGWTAGDVGKLVEIDNSRYEQYIGKNVVVIQAKVDDRLWVHVKNSPSVRFYVVPDFLVRADDLAVSELDGFSKSEFNLDALTEKIIISGGDIVEDIMVERLGFVISTNHNEEGDFCARVIFASRLVKDDLANFFTFRSKTILGMAENIEELINLACDVFDNQYIFLDGDLSLTNRIGEGVNVVIAAENAALWINKLIGEYDQNRIRNAIAFVDLETNSEVWQKTMMAANYVCFLKNGQKPLSVFFFGGLSLRFKDSFSKVGVVLELS